MTWNNLFLVVEESEREKRTQNSPPVSTAKQSFSLQRTEEVVRLLGLMRSDLLGVGGQILGCFFP